MFLTIVIIISQKDSLGICIEIIFMIGIKDILLHDPCLFIYLFIYLFILGISARSLSGYTDRCTLIFEYYKNGKYASQ